MDIIKIDPDLKTIKTNFRQAQAHLHDLRRQIALLEERGIYDAIPTESWQDRGGKGRYLYLYFPQRRDGDGYLGPGRRRKLYIGASPARIAAARRRVQRTRDHRQLNREAERLHTWLRRRAAELNILARQLAAWTAYS